MQTCFKRDSCYSTVGYLLYVPRPGLRLELHCEKEKLVVRRTNCRSYTVYTLCKDRQVMRGQKANKMQKKKERSVMMKNKSGSRTKAEYKGADRALCQ